MTESFLFINKMIWNAKILAALPSRQFAVRYFGSSKTTFLFDEEGLGGTDLSLIDAGVPNADEANVIAGWVSVLLALKAAVDFNIDLRSHDADRHWDHGYVEN